MYRTEWQHDLALAQGVPAATVALAIEPEDMTDHAVLIEETVYPDEDDWCDFPTFEYPYMGDGDA